MFLHHVYAKNTKAKYDKSNENTSVRWSYRGVFAFYIRFIVSLPEGYCLRSPSQEASTCAA